MNIPKLVELADNCNCDYKYSVKRGEGYLTCFCRACTDTIIGNRIKAGLQALGGNITDLICIRCDSGKSTVTTFFTGIALPDGYGNKFTHG